MYFGGRNIPFTCFLLLPPEIRQMIWDQALLQEAKKRFVVISRAQVHRQKVTVAPLKHLVSPFLVLTRESRARAQAFYDVKVEMQGFEVDQPVSFRDLVYRRIAARQSPPRDVLELTKRALRRRPRAMGVVYISPEHDRFVAVSCSFPPPQRDTAEASVILWGYGGYRFDDPSRTASQYVLAPLGKDITARIQTLLLVWQRTRHSSLMFDYLWFVLGYFKRVHDFRYLDIDLNGENGFLGKAVSPWGLSLGHLIIYTHTRR